VTVRLALVATLIALLVVGRTGVLGRGRRPAWILITWVHGSFALAALVIELFDIFGAGPVVRVLTRKVYYHLYLVNGILDTALPLALMALFLGATRYRVWPLLGLVGVAATGLVGAASGALRSWDSLLAVSQLLTFQAIGFYLVFFGLFLLQRLPEVNFYLALFVAIDALFLLLLPIQEVFFRIVGVEAVMDIWHLHQLLQLTATAVQVAIVLSCVNALRYRPLVPILRVPAW
jgi:hypothetical protein